METVARLRVSAGAHRDFLRRFPVDGVEEFHGREPVLCGRPSRVAGSPHHVASADLALVLHPLITGLAPFAESEASKRTSPRTPVPGMRFAANASIHVHHVSERPAQPATLSG